MSRIKGSIKTGGRKAGIPNKVTSDLREWVNALVNNNREQMISDLKKLTPDKRLMFLEKLMSYCVPKMQQNNITMNIDKLSDEDLDLIVNELIKKIK